MNGAALWFTKVFGVVVVLFGCFPDPSLGAWVGTGGPVGGLGYDVRIHPGNKNVMYVTDNYAGVIRSDDGGRNWRSSNSGITVRGGPTLDAYTIFSLTVDPNNPDIIWAGTNGDSGAYGVFKSTDGGTTWTMRNSGITDTGFGLVFRGFTIQPGNSSIVYAQAEVPTAVNGREFNRVQGRVFKTTDGGATWSLIWNGDNLARYLIVAPYDMNTLYLSTGIFDREANNSNCASGVAGAGGVGVLKSTDGGSTWNPLNTGLADLYVGSLRMHPANPLVLFAATGNNACSGGYDGHVVSGLFKTVNGGESWTEVISGKIVTTVNFSPSSPNIMYAGGGDAFYRSTDGGDTWTTYTKPSSNEWGPLGVRAGVPIDVTVDPDDPNVLYANNYGGGVFRSTDGAQTWEIWSKGYSGADLHDAVIAAGTPPSAAVFVVGRSGPFKSENFGVDWAGIGNGAATYAEWYSIAVKPLAPNVVLLADEHQGVIMRSTDGGGDFSEIFRHPGANASNPATREGFKALVFAPSQPNIVYAGLAKDRSTIDTSTPTGQHTLYKSTDSGTTFSSPTSDLDGLNIYRLTVDETNADTVWAATSGGVYQSSDGGTIWSQLAGALGTRVILDVKVKPGAPSYLVASEKEGGIWISTDGGDTWAGPYHGSFDSTPNPTVVALVFDPDDATKLYAADFYSGVYRSEDGGMTWAKFPDPGMSGLAVRAVKDFAFADGVLYAATQGGGLFRYGGPELVPSPASQDFGGVASGATSAPASITIYNTGASDRTISGKTLGGDNASEFALHNDTCPAQLPASSSCTVAVVFSPSATAGAKRAVLTIVSDDPHAPNYPISLSGLAALGDPASISVPVSDADGSYTVSWGASTTSEVTYLLQEATNNAFSAGVRTAYSGTGSSSDITGRATGVRYYYRVKATKPGHEDSAWRIAGNACAVSPAAPAAIAVSVGDPDGTYTVSWGASPASGVRYFLQEASSYTFSAGLRTAYRGVGRSVGITSRAQGKTYYYRVKATKTGYADSAWKNGGNGCAVPGTAVAGTPSSLTFTAIILHGYTVNWGASATSGVSYVLEEARNSGFTAGLRRVYTGTARSAKITGRLPGVTYYYRVRAIKAGVRDSAWRIGSRKAT